MSLGDLEPRQKMINLMYLVLLCLLAMNVSKEILHSFIIINEGLERTTENFESKINQSYERFARMMADDPKKVGEFYEHAKELKTNADEIVDYIEKIKIEIYRVVDQIPQESADTMTLEHCHSKDNQDVGAMIMIGQETTQPKGPEVEFSALGLKQKMETFNSHLEEFISDKEAIKELKIPLEDQVVHDVVEKWEIANFYHLPVAATITNLTRFQAAVRNSEADALKELLKDISAEDFSFDTLAVKVIPHSGTYITQGDSFRADVIVAAYSTTKNPQLVIGTVDTTSEQPDVVDGDTSEVTYNRGIATYGTKADQLGEQNWGGVIKILKPNGKWAHYKFEHKYMVAKPSLVVAPTAMNVFYKGLENPVDISVSGLASEKLSLSVDGCQVRTVNKAGGKYEIIPNNDLKAKEVAVRVTADIDGKKVSYPPQTYRIKTVPKPIPKFLNETGTVEMTKGQLTSGKFVSAVLEDFLFDLRFKVTKFEMFISVGGKSQTIKTNGNQLSGEMESILRQMKPGQTVIFNNVSAVMDKPGSVARPLDGSIIVNVK
ncbi:MAG: gliding motility protein GldM [Flavobacteriales bacterium]|nr:gliding motility protein GldM [Flavobacteriales bacterium]